jgi:S1-C subfamily serine protease
LTIDKTLGRSVKILLGLLLCWHISGFSQNENARTLFADNKTTILQIRVIDVTSGSKTAIGSGFVVNSQGLIATNYHVVQLAASKPEQYRIEYLTADDQAGDLQLVDVDVINDLALVSAHNLKAQPLSLAVSEPPIGVPVFALGNPLDLGLTVVPGTYNGINQTSYHPRVHFTGSLNSGMSGGPTLSEAGQVIGINVSTAGNQVSFLVPVTALHQLIAEYHGRPAALEDMTQRIGQQLFDDQEEKFNRMLALEWPTMPLGQAQVIDELKPFVKCWGGSNSSSEKAQFLSADRTCRSEDNIYLRGKFNSGIIEYQFFWLEADKLNALQFYAYYQRLFDDFVPGNNAEERDVGDFNCDDQFVIGGDALKSNAADKAERKTKAVFCARAYKDYPQLYDVLFLQATADDSRAAFLSHFTLAGVSQKNAKAFTRKFMGVATWR